MDEALRVCMPVALSDMEQLRAAELAVAENPTNARDIDGKPLPPARLGEEIAGLTAFFWRPGRTLRVKFLDGDPVVQERVEAVAHTWSRYANLKLDFGDHLHAHIRISFEGAGSWSYIGTQALVALPHKPTMNYGWLTVDSAESEVQRVVLHEFGHALGCIHEHQHPLHEIPWDEDAVYAYYTGPPNNWSRRKTDRNVLKPASVHLTQFTAFDPHSIMLYPVPKRHTLGDFEIPWRNRELSTSDKQFIAHVYPLAFDAAVALASGSILVFRGEQYARFTPGQPINDGYPSLIRDGFGRNLPLDFAGGIHAAVQRADGKLFLFRRGQFVRYTPGQGVDAGYPRTLEAGFGLPHPFSRGIDAALSTEDGNVLFFRNDQVVRYHFGIGMADGYPRPIADLFPAWPNAYQQGIDAAIRRPDGSILVCKDERHLRLTSAEDPAPVLALNRTLSPTLFI